MVSVIIVAGGLGLRMGSDIPKQYIKVNNKEIIAHTIEKFENISTISEIILVCPKRDIKFCESIIKFWNFKKVNKIVAGGDERQASVYNGIIEAECDTILVHDGVRANVSEKIINDVIKNINIYNAVIPVVKVKESVKFSKDGSFVDKSISRDDLYLAQTPQGFTRDLLLKAYEKNIPVTDDSALVSELGIKVKMVEGDYKNIKLTTKDDLGYLEFLLRR